MAGQEGFPTNRDLLFDGTNYALWSIRMITYLMAPGFDIWKLVATGYTVPKNPLTDAAEKKDSEHNEKSMNVILCGLLESQIFKVMHCESTKDIWDKLQNIYEGDGKVKKEKLQTHRIRFESLKVKDEENVASYFLRVDEIVNTIRGLGEKKVLRPSPLRFYAKVFVIE
jgi:hypothetical protein